MKLLALERAQNTFNIMLISLFQFVGRKLCVIITVARYYRYTGIYAVFVCAIRIAICRPRTGIRGEDRDTMANLLLEADNYKSFVSKAVPLLGM